MTKELLNNEHCSKEWKDLEPTGTGKFCSTCQVNLIDLTKLPISEIVEKHLDSGKCVRLTDSQINFLSFYKNFRKSVAVSSIIIGSSFFNFSYSQSINNSVRYKDSCLVVGKVMFENDNSPSRNLPKNCTIQYSNLKKLKTQKIGSKSKIKLGKNKIHRENKRRMGWL